MLLFVCLYPFASGRPPRVRRRDGHGDGALRPGGGRLRRQSLLLRLRPERGQVHLPEEVRVWPLGAFISSSLIVLTSLCC